MDEIERLLTNNPDRRIELSVGDKVTFFHAIAIEADKTIICSGSGASMKGCLRDLARTINDYFYETGKK